MKSQHNGQSSGRQSRRPYGSYQFSLERRACAAATMANENGWPTKQAAGLFAVNATYIDLVRHLNADDRLRLARGELKLAQVHKEHLQQLAERRAQRLAAEREAEVHAARQAQLQAIQACLDQVSLTRFLEQAIARYGGADVLEELDVLFQRRGSNIVDLIISTYGAERVMRTFDHATAPERIAAE
jgi:hypothetical protein